MIDFPNMLSLSVVKLFLSSVLVVYNASEVCAPF